MTRKLQKLALGALLTGFFSAAAFGQIATPPVIDGDAGDAVWATVTAMDLLRDNGSAGVTDAADFSGSIKVLWDANTVYCLLQVMDDTLITDLNQPWERDHYSIYFDLLNLKTAAILTEGALPLDSAQFMLEKVWSVEGNLAMKDSSLVWGVDFVEKIDSGSMYTLEVAVPFSKLGVTLTADAVIGFDAKIGDNDADGSLDGKYSLYQILDEGWRNPSYLGTAKLEADGSLSKVKHAPVIDGMADYAWYAASTHKLEVKNLVTGVASAADFSGTFKVMHDLDNIYVMLEVKDDTLITDLNQPWERDHYSVYFDFNNLKTSTFVTDAAAPMDSVQFMLEKIWSVAGDLAMEDTSLVNGVDFVENITEGKGYILEMVVPMDILGVTLAEEMVIGFDMKIGDNDADGTLDGKYSWHQSMDEGWRNPGYLGNMKLEPVFVDLGPLSPAPQTIKVDGVAEGNWNQAIAMPLLRENLVTGIDNAADFSGTVKALWDTDYVYILLQVKDDTLVTDLNQPWERDHYSVYFDFNNHKSATYLVDQAPPMDSVQFMLEKIWSVEGDLAMEDTSLIWGVDFSEVIDSGSNYTLEIAIPLELIGVELKAGQVIGFDAKIGDNDADGNLDGKLSWNQFADEGWRNPSYLGNVTLMANGTFMGTPETPPVDVTFNVDMTGMIAAEIFDPAVDKVDLAGSMNNWGDPVKNAADADADGIYTIVVASVEVGTNLEFKFRVNGTWDPISEFPGGGPNRTYTAVEGENIVNVVFNDGDYTPWITGVDVNKASYLQMYPNPAVNAVTLSSAVEIQSVNISNITGQLIYSAPVNGFTTDLNISNLESGMYIVSVKFVSMEVSNRVLIKK
ncbi:MAG: sugar-binding protein [Bacteroidales bacterium]